MSRKLDEINNNEARVDLQKRKFMGKFGKYAIVGAGMATLMTPNASASFNSGCKPRKLHRDNGWGNGDDQAPGRSGPHNNAENNHDGNPHKTGKWESHPD